MPFTFQVRIDEANLGVRLAGPLVVSEVLFEGSGPVAREQPILRLQREGREFEVRMRFPAWVTVRVARGQSVDQGSLLASGVAEGEDIPEGFRYCSVHEPSPGRD